MINLNKEEKQKLKEVINIIIDKLIPDLADLNVATQEPTQKTQPASQTENQPMAFDTCKELLEFSENNNYHVKHDKLVKWIKQNRGKWLYLINANLRRANLIDAYLRGANLSCADLSCADLTGANLINAYLTDVCYSTTTKFPDGFNPKRAGMTLIKN